MKAIDIAGRVVYFGLGVAVAVVVFLVGVL